MDGMILSDTYLNDDALVPLLLQTFVKVQVIHRLPVRLSVGVSVWIMKWEVSDEMASIRRKQVDGDRGERRRKESHLNKIIKQCGSYSHKHVVLQLIHPSYPIVDGCEGGADVRVAIRFSKISKIWNSQFTNSRNPKILSCSCETPSTHLCIPSPFSSSSPLPLPSPPSPSLTCNIIYHSLSCTVLPWWHPFFSYIVNHYSHKYFTTMSMNI